MAIYADLQVLENAVIYEGEIDNYITPNDDSALSYIMYSSQRL